MISLPRALMAGLTAALLPLLAACADKAQPPAAEASAAATGSLTVSNARMVLAPVAGNPAAVYFDLAYAGVPGTSLTGVEVEGAGLTMIHDYEESAGKLQMVMLDSVPLTAQAPVSFAPGGLHVMVMEPSDTLKPGGTAKLTLTLSDGTTAALEAPVRAAGDER